MGAKNKIDLGMTGYDELFMNDTSRKESRLPRIHNVPLPLIDEFPDHPFHVRDDEDMANLLSKLQVLLAEQRHPPKNLCQKLPAFLLK